MFLEFYMEEYLEMNFQLGVNFGSGLIMVKKRLSAREITYPYWILEPLDVVSCNYLAIGIHY